MGLFSTVELLTVRFSQNVQGKGGATNLNVWTATLCIENGIQWRLNGALSTVELLMVL